MVVGWPTVYYGSPVELAPRAHGVFAPHLAPGSWRTGQGETRAAALGTLMPLLEAYGVSQHEAHVADAVRAALPEGAREAATIDERGTSSRASKRSVARQKASHHSSGRCSAPPPGNNKSSVGSNSLPSTSPPAVTSPTLAPEVPRSHARTHRVIHRRF